MQVWPGQPSPLGATHDGVGTNFSVFSEIAERVELCLYDDEGQETRVALSQAGDRQSAAHALGVSVRTLQRRARAGRLF